MRNLAGLVMIAACAVLAMSSVAAAQQQWPTGVPSASSAGYIKEGVPKMPDPPGPAPNNKKNGNHH